MIPVIYIVGDGRSGSTLLERRLAAFEGALAVGEQRYVWGRARRESSVTSRAATEAAFRPDILCSCGAALDSCPFWCGVRERVAGTNGNLIHGERMAELLLRLDRVRYSPAVYWRVLRSRPFSDAWHEVRADLARWYAAMYAQSGRRVLIDTSKTPMYGALLGSIPTLDVAYIHLVRDSRAVAFSWARRQKRMPEFTARDEVFPRFKPSVAAMVWDVTYASTLMMRRPRRDRVLDMRYEAFAKRPDQTIDSVVRFLDSLGFPSLGTQELDAPLERYHSVAGNPIRFDRARPVISVDEEWRARMGTRDRAVVTTLTAPFLAHHLWRLRRSDMEARHRQAVG